MDDINHISEADYSHPTTCSSCGAYELSSGHCLECDRVVTYDDLIEDEQAAIEDSLEQCQCLEPCLTGLPCTACQLQADIIYGVAI